MGSLVARSLGVLCCAELVSPNPPALARLETLSVGGIWVEGVLGSQPPRRRRAPPRHSVVVPFVFITLL